MKVSHFLSAACRFRFVAVGALAGLAILSGAEAASQKPPPRPAASARPAAPPKAAPIMQQGQGVGFRSSTAPAVHLPGSVAGQARGAAGGTGAGGAVPPGVHLPHSVTPRAAPVNALPERHAGVALPAPRQAAHPPRQAATADQKRSVPARLETRRGSYPVQGRFQPATTSGVAGRSRSDPRLGDGKLLHTVGVTGPAVLRAGPRPFLRPEEHRDVVRDRAFLRSHAADFHTRRVAAFDAHELHRWQAGAWRNEWHYGRRGWWWEVGGVWYGYPEPIFPYPEEVAPLVVYDAPVVDGPDMTVAETGPSQDDALADPAAPAESPAPATASIAPLPATPLGWYRCDQPGGYYPGLDSCGTYWALVQNAPMPGE